MPAEVNQRYSKSANFAAIKFLLDGQGRVFSDFRVLCAANTCEAFEGHDVDFDDCKKVASGHDSLALRRKSSVMTAEGLEDRHRREWVGELTGGVQTKV